MNSNASPIAPGFMVLHGNRLEDLRELLVDVIKTYRLGVLSPEIILVQNNGMKHWLEMSLASDEAFGICAATRIELPSSYLWSIYRTILMDVHIPVQMPFDKKNLIWRLYKILPHLIEKEKFEPLKRYIGDVSDTRRLYQLANQIADVFDGYQNYRADWLMDWAVGNDQLLSDTYLDKPALPMPLKPEETWQSELWRALREDIGPDLANASRANVHAQFLNKMDAVISHHHKSGQKPKGIPDRVVIFGISSLPPQVIEAFAKLGQICQVFMFVQNPCQYYWGDIVDGNEMLRALNRRRQKINPNDFHMITQPLLASWGKQGRDYFHLLDIFDNVNTYKDKLKKVDVFVDPVAREGLEGLGDTKDIPPTQLALVQSSIFNLTASFDEQGNFEQTNFDDSIQFVSAHSAQREVEILHDQLHSWFDQNANAVTSPAQRIKPQDVMVMVPDMEAFLPHIRAVFGRFRLGDKRYIPYSIADTTPKETPIVQALTQLLSLPNLKISLVDWLSLFEVDAVCKKFELSSDEVIQLKDWCQGAGIRWGLDGKHRVQHAMDAGLSDLEQNTWAFGIRRLLLGYALGQNQVWANTLAFRGVRGLDGPLMSKLLAWVDAVETLNTSLREDHSPSDWVKILRSVKESFFDASGDDAQERLLERIFEPLEHWELICKGCGLDSAIALHVVRDYWLSQLGDVGLQKRFFGGGVQFGTLMPMRSIPFKVICLLGMNDGDFPRQTSSRDFDLMAKHWRTGDRSRREDDRYLFLEALICAREKLYISWEGHDVRDNSEKPPSVVVAQFMDYLNSVFANKVVPVNYPLQPFSNQYFELGSDFFTYDKDWQIQRQAQVAENSKQNLRGEEPELEKLNLSELQRLLRYPVEVFFRSRLNIYMPKLEEEAADSEPFALNALEEYSITSELLNVGDLEMGLKNLKLSGKLPLQESGKNISQDLLSKSQDIVAHRQAWFDQFPGVCLPISLSVDLGRTTLEGVLTNLRSKPSADNSEVHYLQLESRVGAVCDTKKKIQVAKANVITRLWVKHLFLCASGYSITSVQIGSDAQIVMSPLGAEQAIQILNKLVSVYKEAWLRPIPVACKTGWAWLVGQSFNEAAKAQAQAQAQAYGKAEGEGEGGGEGEGQELEDPHELAEEEFDPPNPRWNGPIGERKDSPYLMRAFLDYVELRDELPHYSQRLYSEMLEFALVKSHAEEAA